MNKKPSKKPEVKSQNSSHKTISRSKRNARERKCLPKRLKVLFRNDSGAVMKIIHQAWIDGRKKPASKDTEE